uniref:Uncharacterized protein n=1 Tax=Knipowitschia caucasica TaxID=637954 RepID=A0AAV2L7T7_KNICA
MVLSGQCTDALKCGSHGASGAVSAALTCLSEEHLLMPKQVLQSLLLRLCCSLFGVREKCAGLTRSESSLAEWYIVPSRGRSDPPQLQPISSAGTPSSLNTSPDKSPCLPPSLTLSRRWGEVPMSGPLYSVRGRGEAGVFPTLGEDSRRATVLQLQKQAPLPPGPLPSHIHTCSPAHTYLEEVEFLANTAGLKIPESSKSSSRSFLSPCSV